MKYRPTVLNISAVIVLIYDGYKYFKDFINDIHYQYGAIAMFMTGIIVFSGLLLDYFLQKKIKKYFILNLVELLVVLIFILFTMR
jgi:predicted MFS family arabinose efflux permease